jgi:hypothetical protein
MVRYLDDIDRKCRNLGREQVLSKLPDHCHGFLLAHTTPEGVTHVKCIKQQQGNNKWFSLDSMVAPYVYELNNEADWQALDGDVLPGSNERMPDEQHLSASAAWKFRAIA